MKQPETDDFINLLEFLESTPARISELIEGLSDSELRWKKTKSKFSALENICHLRDLEIWGYLERISGMINETKPAFFDFDGAGVAARSLYNCEDLYLAFETFSVKRKQNVKRLRSLTAEQLKQKAFLEGVGRITFRRVVGLMREHDEGHLEDLRILRQTIEKKRSRD